VLLGVLLLIIVTAFVLGMFARVVLGNMAPIAEQGAGFLKPSDAVFYLFAAGAIVSAAGVAFSRSIIYSALGLLGALLSTGALYVMLNADYVAITQLLIYIGGVLVLILFAVMLTSRISEKKHTNPAVGVLPGLGLLAALLGVFTYVAAKAPWKVGPTVLVMPDTAREIGNLFLDHYLLPFEVASLVLLATLVGAVVIARKEIKEG
jgi:NAD(P)H-quinone oxidoreductase subunit 6